MPNLHSALATKLIGAGTKTCFVYNFLFVTRLIYAKHSRLLSCIETEHFCTTAAASGLILMRFWGFSVQMARCKSTSTVLFEPRLFYWKASKSLKTIVLHSDAIFFFKYEFPCHCKHCICMGTILTWLQDIRIFALAIGFEIFNSATYSLFNLLMFFRVLFVILFFNYHVFVTPSTSLVVQ